MKFYKVITLSFLFLQSLNLIGQEIKTTTDKSDYNITDNITVTYQIDKSIDSADIIDESEFKVISGPSQSLSTTYLNGKSTKSTSYSYIIKPLSVGKISLPRLIMHVDEKPIRSEEMFIEVTGTLLTDKQIEDKIKTENSPLKEYKAGHTFDISMPAYLERTVDVNNAAAIQYGNTAKTIFGYTSFEKKEDIQLSGGKYTSLDKYHGSTIVDFSKKMPKKKTVSQPLIKKGKDINFVATDITYHDAETNENVYYFIGSAETKTTLYTVVFYTLMKNKAKFKADFQKVLYSLKD